MERRKFGIGIAGVIGASAIPHTTSVRTAPTSRLERQGTFLDAKKRFTFLMTESAVLWPILGAEGTAVQADHVAPVANFASVSTAEEPGGEVRSKFGAETVSMHSPTATFTGLLTRAQSPDQARRISRTTHAGSGLRDRANAELERGSRRCIADCRLTFRPTRRTTRAEPVAGPRFFGPCFAWPAASDAWPALAAWVSGVSR